MRSPTGPDGLGGIRLWSHRHRPSLAALSPANDGRPVRKVDVVDLESRHFPCAEAGVDHQSDGRLVPAIAQRHLGLGALGWLARLDEARRSLSLSGSMTRSSSLEDSTPRNGRDLVLVGEPGREPPHGELARSGHRGCGAPIEQRRDPQVQRRPGHRIGIVGLAPVEVHPHAVPVGLERLWALALGT